VQVAKKVSKPAVKQEGHPTKKKLKTSQHNHGSAQLKVLNRLSSVHMPGIQWPKHHLSSYFGRESLLLLFNTFDMLTPWPLSIATSGGESKEEEEE
jgi:hypothetical protein